MLPAALESSFCLFPFDFFLLCYWRRGRDSNSRSTKWTPVFKTGAFNHSATPPLTGNSKQATGNSKACPPNIKLHDAVCPLVLCNLLQPFHIRAKNFGHNGTPILAHLVLAVCLMSLNLKFLISRLRGNFQLTRTDAKLGKKRNQGKNRGTNWDGSGRYGQIVDVS